MPTAAAASNSPPSGAARLYGPASAQFGSDMERLLFVKTQPAQDLLWAMEERLRARRFAVVIGEWVSPDLIQMRRLQPAAPARVDSPVMFGQA